MKKFIALLLALTIMCFCFVACSNNTDDEPKETESTEVAPQDEVAPEGEVKLTLENFDTFFEFVEEPFFTKDSSGKTDSLRFRHYYKIKDTYKIDITKSNVEITYKHSYTLRPITVDFNSETFEFGSESNEKQIIKDRKINSIQEITAQNFAILLFQPSKIDKSTVTTPYYSDFEVTDVNGTLYFVK